MELDKFREFCVLQGVRPAMQIKHRMGDVLIAHGSVDSDDEVSTLHWKTLWALSRDDKVQWAQRLYFEPNGKSTEDSRIKATVKRALEALDYHEKKYQESMQQEVGHA